MTRVRPTNSTQDFMRREMFACAEDPKYFLKTYAKIIHPTKGKLAFKTYAFQDDCIDAFMENRFNIILKSRQLGLSTVTAGFVTWYALFARDKNILVIATKLDVAMNFIKKVKTILDNLPPWFNTVVKISGETKKSVSLNNGSTITAIPTSEDAGRSEALSLLIVDEAAIIKDFEEIWTGLFPTVSVGGRVVLLSTPKGASGQFYNMWQQAVNKEIDFNPITLKWDVHPEHDDEWLKNETKGWSIRRIAQEYLCDFNASGDTFLQMDDMEWIRSEIKPPIDKAARSEALWIWERPVLNEKYVISADVSRGNAEDFSTFHVFKDSTNEMVAEYKAKLPPDEFGQQLFDVATRYNNALVCPENNTYGYSTIRTLKTLGYKNLYYEGKRAGYIPLDDKEMPGFSTQKASREKVLLNLEKAVRNKTIRIYSERLYLELKTFIYVGQRARAQEGNHDDLVMSLAIAVWLLDPNSGAQIGDDYAKAFLQAMSVSTRKADDMMGMGKEIRALSDPMMTMGNPTNFPQPLLPERQTLRDHITRIQKVPDVNVNDFSWILK